MLIKKNTKLKYKTIYLLILILFIALGLRVCRVFLVDRYDKDGVLYVKMADAFAENNPEGACDMRPEMPALFPYAIGQIRKVLNINAETIGVVFNIICGTAAVFAAFLFASLFCGKRIALFVALLCAVNPVMVENSIGVMREQCALMLVLFSLFFVVKGIKNKKINLLNWCIAGFLLALASMIRPDGPECIPVLLIWMVITFLFFKKERKKILFNILPRSFVLMIVFFATAIPIQSYFNKYGSYYTVVPNAKMLRIYLKIDR